MHALGRKEYGRLGVGEGGEDCLVPTQVPGLAAARCLEVAAGTAVSYAVTEDGDCLAWGMGTNGQLGTGEEVSIALHCIVITFIVFHGNTFLSQEDVYEPVKMKGKQLQGKKVLVVSSGGQHTVMIAKEDK